MLKADLRGEYEDCLLILWDTKDLDSGNVDFCTHLVVGGRVCCSGGLTRMLVGRLLVIYIKYLINFLIKK